MGGESGEQAPAEVDELGGGDDLGGVVEPRLAVELTIVLHRRAHRDLDGGLQGGKTGDLVGTRCSCQRSRSRVSASMT